VAVLNERAAREFFPGRDAIGQALAFGSAPDRAYTIVGIATDTPQETLRLPAPRIVYTPISQEREPESSFQVAVKVAGDPKQFAGQARDAVRTVNRDLVVSHPRTMTEQVDSSFVRERGLAWLAGTFAVFALLLGCVGIYGVTSYQMARRTKEIGLRLALGARPATVLVSVLRQTMVLAVIGAAAGVAAALLAAAPVATLLYDLPPRDPWTLAAVSAFLVTIALVAASVPAYRASRTDLLRALKNE
jgi:predicted lysophospholipase L1 biosynthesis ABC-type transport system permease subunit